MHASSGISSRPWWFALMLFATLVACGDGPEASAPPVDAPDANAHTRVHDDGSVQLSELAMRGIEVSAVGDADDMDRAMVPAVVELKDTAVSAVFSPVQGHVETLHVVEGQRVRKGDVLATVRSPELINLQAELRAAQARLTFARDVNARQTQLEEDGVAVAAEVSEARSRLSEAESDVARLRGVLRSVGSTTAEALALKAQRDGVVVTRTALTGDAVGPGEDPLMLIGDTADLWLVAHVFEGDLERVIPDSRVRVHLPGGIGETEGTIVRVGEVVETTLRRAPVWVELDEVKGLRPGMMGQAGLRLRADHALRLPPTAVLLDETGVYRVWVEDAEGRFRAREVVAGHTRHGLVEVKSGIQAGERVVTRGALLLDASASMRL